MKIKLRPVDSFAIEKLEIELDYVPRKGEFIQFTSKQYEITKVIHHAYEGVTLYLRD